MRLIETMVPAMMFNNGQMCLQPSRLLIPEGRKDEIVGAFVRAFAKVVAGPPADPKTKVGPLISSKQHEHVMGLLQSAITEGGRFAIGGGRPEGLNTGYYVSPTIITDVSPDARVAKEEIFAPVLVVLTYTDEEAALEIVNNTEFGLKIAGGIAGGNLSQKGARRTPAPERVAIRDSTTRKPPPRPPTVDSEKGMNGLPSCTMNQSLLRVLS